MKKEYNYVLKKLNGYNLFSLSNTYYLPVSSSLAIYKILADEVIQSATFFSVSQFYDERQDLIQNSLGLAQEMYSKYALKALSTDSFYSSTLAQEGTSNYIIHFFGPKHLSALDRIIRYGGSNLLSIICGFEKDTPDWLSTVLELGRNLSRVNHGEDFQKNILKTLEVVNGILIMENNSINAFFTNKYEGELINRVRNFFAQEKLPLKKDDNLLAD